MFFKGQDRKDVYAVFEDVYYTNTATKFGAYKKGERDRIIMIASLVSDIIDEHEDRAKVLLATREYLIHGVSKWMEWKDGTRANVIGFLDKKDKIQQFLLRSSSFDKNKIAAATIAESNEELSDF